MRSLHIVGDSISMHYGPDLGRFLAGSLAYSRKTGFPGNLDHPQGANGGDSSLVLAYLQDCSEAGRTWEALAINCGLHDLKRDITTRALQVPEDAYRSNLDSIIAESRGLASQLVWIRTTPVVDAVHNRPGMQFHRHAADLQRYNAIADAVMQAANVEMIDLEAFTRALGGDELFCDHVHFTEPVRRLQAAFLAGALQAQLS
jgi:hypothetical protein